MYRYYFMYGDFTSCDCLLQLVIIGSANLLIFWCLWKATNSDCGRIPKFVADFQDDGGTARNICHRCGANREDPFTHHCGTCDACVELMDHHCWFIGQCVGKGNFKYFMQYCMYISGLLFYGAIKSLWLCLTNNPRHGHGIQGFTWLYLPTPFHAPWMFFISVENGGYELLRTVDNFLVIFQICWGIFAFCIPIEVLKNIRRNTSEVDKLRPGKISKVFVTPRSIAEIVNIVFGVSPSTIDYIFPTATRFDTVNQSFHTKNN